MSGGITMKKRKIINWISAVAAISAIMISLSFISERVKDYRNMTKAVSNTVSYINTPLPEKKEPEKYEQIIAEKRDSIPVKETEIKDSEPKYLKPASGEIIAEYSENNIVFLDETGDYRTHSGIDIKTDGHGVVSVDDGIVLDLYEDFNNYYVLRIKHDEFDAIYRNIIINSDISIGRNIKKGDLLGKGVISEKYGEYMHFEIEKEGKTDNPIKYFE